MKHKPVTKKYEPERWIREKCKDFKQCLGCGGWFRRDYYDDCPLCAIDNHGFFQSTWEAAQHLLEEEPDGAKGLFQCGSCEKIMKREYPYTLREFYGCMGCGQLQYCCHYPGGDWTILRDDEKCADIEGHHQDGTSCACEEQA